MSTYRVNQHLLSFTKSKFDIKYVNTVKLTTEKVYVFKSNRMFGIKHSKINRLQKTIEYQTNEQSTKYSKCNIKTQSC